jgi:putative spermidine/putrescine transport system ATP-binding protein
MDAFVYLENITKRYGSVVAADHISLDIQEGEFVTLLGPSGSGKTTILMTLAGFIKPDEGRIFVKGKEISEIPPYRRDMGLVFQNYALFPHMTVFANIAYSLKMRRVPKAKTREMVHNVLDVVKLSGMGGRMPSQLSGGQQQRVAVARALVFEPAILLMDEPLGALDKKLRDQMQLELKNLQRNLGITVLYVTHDQGEALSMSTKIVIMRDGRIEQLGTGLDIYEHPIDEFVCDFLGEVNSFSAEVVEVEDDFVYVSSPCLGRSRAKLRNCTFDIGQQVHFTVRPEKIFFLEQGTDLECGFKGQIHDTIYLGDVTKYWVRLSGASEEKGEGVVLVNVQNRVGNEVYNVGDHIRIGWDEEDAVVV